MSEIGKLIAQLGNKPDEQNIARLYTEDADTLWEELKQAETDARMRRMVETLPEDLFLWHLTGEILKGWHVLKWRGRRFSADVKGKGDTPDAALKAALEAAGMEVEA